MAVTDLDDARKKTGWPAGQDDPPQTGEDVDEGKSIADRAADPDDEPQAEMFPVGSLPGDPKRTYKNIIPAGTATKIQAKLSNTAVPMTDGLYAFGERGEILVTFEAGKVAQVPELGDEKSDGTRKLNGVKLVQELRGIFVRDGRGMYTHEQVVDLLAAVGVKPDKVAEMLGEAAA